MKLSCHDTGYKWNVVEIKAMMVSMHRNTQHPAEDCTGLAALFAQAAAHNWQHMLDDGPSVTGIVLISRQLRGATVHAGSVRTHLGITIEPVNLFVQWATPTLARFLVNDIMLSLSAYSVLYGGGLFL